MSNHTKTDNEWKKLLSDESFRVTRQAGTEKPFTGKYWNFNENGVVKNLRSRRVDRYHFCRTRWSCDAFLLGHVVAQASHLFVCQVFQLFF